MSRMAQGWLGEAGVAPGRELLAAGRTVLAVAVALTALGLVITYSSSSARAVGKGEDVNAVFVRQVCWTLLAAGACTVMARVPLETIGRWSRPLLTAVVVMLVATKLLGVEVNGARRWLGVGGMRADVITGLALSLNGNAITLGAALSEEIGVPVQAREDAAATARALAAYLERGPRQVTLAAAHTFSCHILQLRHWLRAGGIDPQRDVNIIVLPPEQMVDSLSRGVIDGYCVGEPWNTIAVQHGVGSVQATGYQIWNNGLEKVLGVTEHWHRRHPATHLRLRLALMEACTWLADPHHREPAAAILSSADYLDLPRESLTPSLTGRFAFRKGELDDAAVTKVNDQLGRLGGKK